MPLNRLDNFIKNTEGRVLYVNPNDLDSTDSIENQGNALARPFKTIQRAIIEAARFSYVKGNNNDLLEKTTILLFPGEHLIDNRPGFAIYNNSGSPFAVSRSGGTGVLAASVLSLDADSNFDLNQEDNILYKFNSFYGGVVVPRGISIVGIDIRKTKIRPKYVPNPTDFTAASSTIFRLTGGSHFAQLTFLDGNERDLVYTNPDVSDLIYQSAPTFSHHKLSCFEFCDGVNEVDCYGLTDLDMYYAKLTNAYNTYRNIDQKFPTSELGFVKSDPEWEIVGDFASDPVEISTLISGNGLTASALVTVTTSTPHKLNEGTPIKIKGVTGAGIVAPYNISTRVQNIISETQFTYLLPALASYLTINPSPNASNATVTVETDTVSGASPYIFNCSLRSVWGMNGLLADGYKASGFRSTVVAQFTAVSLQKDDRAFVKYDPVSRTYQGISFGTVYGAELASGSASTDSNKIYHLDSEAVYRKDWETSHLKIINDAFIQISSVFAIGFNKQFDVESGGDASIANSNSNFGQFALSSTGFKREVFSKDNKAFITSIIAPKSIDINRESKIEWLPIDVGLTTAVGVSSHIYIYGFTSADEPPPAQAQGHRIGGMENDILYFTGPSNVLPSSVTYSAQIHMCDSAISIANTIAQGTTSAVKFYRVIGQPSSNSFTIGSNQLITGEKVKIVSDDGDLPENIEDHRTYYVINNNDNNTIKLASTYTEAEQGEALTVYKGTNLSIFSRVTDKDAGDLGSPIQYDPINNNWFIHVNSNNEIYNALFIGGIGVFETSTDLTFVNRVLDRRNLDDKVYKLRVVIPKEYKNARDPQTGFILQETSTTGVRNDTDFTRTSIGRTDYDYNKNPRFISTCSVSSSTVTVIAELPHNLQINDVVNILNVTSSNNTTAEQNEGYNGTFTVTSIVDANTFHHSTIDVFGNVHDPGSFTNNTSIRNTNLPRFERNDLSKNLYIYKNDIISPYIYNKQDGIYHLYVLNASNSMNVEFTNLEFSQAVTDLYPQIDRDDIDDNPPAAKTFAKRFPIGEVVTNDLKKSITRETTDITLKALGYGIQNTSVSSSTNSATITFARFHGLSGIVTGSIISGATYNPISGIQTYHNVKILNGSQNPNVGTWNGATARVIVNNGAVTSASIVSPGSGYTATSLYFDQTRIGAGNGAARYVITTAGISTNIGDVVQFTGVGTVSDTYHRITSIPSSTQISIAKTAGDPTIHPNQYAFVIGPSVRIASTTYDSNTGITTFITSSAHGLLAGNRFRVLNSSNNNRGDYIVKSKVSVTSFSAVTNSSLSVTNGYILKHGLSANNASSDFVNENIGVRGVSVYEGETFTLTSAITAGTTINITSSGIGTAQRLPLGSYIQIDEEIMRIASSNNTTSATVIRGVLGTRQENHSINSLVTRIHPIPIEFRRPSIIRASGHTFEYLGYGPGNYSTSLPQVQVREITERENFLAQSQERSGGIVAYSGMNNEGEFFFGNTKTSSMSGDSISYDAPNQTVAGDDSTRRRLLLPVDEITVYEKIVVEGGPENSIVSLFEGPVVFDNQTRFNDTVTVNAQLRVIPGVDSTSTRTGDVVVYGGVGIGKNLYVGGLVRFVNETQSNSCTTGALVISGGVGIAKNLNVCGDAQISGITTIIGRNGTDSTTKDNGALVVEGGVGIEKSVNIGGNVKIFSGTLSNSCTTGALIVTGSGGAGIGGNLNVCGLVEFSNETQSNSCTTGALVISGGVGIAKNLNVCGDAQISGITTIIGRNGTDSTTKDNGALVVEGGVGIEKSVNIGGNINVTGYGIFDAVNIFTSGAPRGDLYSSGGSDGIFDIRNTTNSGVIRLLAKTSTGVYNDILSVNSGIATVGGKLVVESSQNSTSITEGALVVEGGAGIGEDVNIGGNLNVTGYGIFDAVNIFTSGAPRGDLYSSGGSDGIFDIRNTSNNGQIKLFARNSGGTYNDILSVGFNTATVDGQLVVESSLQSSSCTTGALVVKGGVGIAKNLNVCEDLNVTGDVNVTGTIYGDIDKTVNAGDGLIGGGDLTNDITLSVNPGDGIIISDDKVSVDNTVVRTLPEGTTIVVLHVCPNNQTPLTGSNSVPYGYPTTNHTYVPNAIGIRGTLFETVTDALETASVIYTPVGGEVVISVHADIGTPEIGPIMLSNSTAPFVIAGARGASNPSIKFKRGITQLVTTRLPQYSGLRIYSAGAKFNDINIEVDCDNTEGDQGFLSLNGGFGIGNRDLNIVWKNCGDNSRVTNATASNGEKIIFRFFFDENGPLDTIYNFHTDVKSTVGPVGVTMGPTDLLMIGQAGGLLGQGIDVLFDYKSASYGQRTGGGNQFKPTMKWKFSHSALSVGFEPSKMVLKFMGFGGRGGCFSCGRVGPKVLWDFSDDNWDMSDFFDPFINQKNYLGPSFKTRVPSDYLNGIGDVGVLGVTNYTQNSIANSPVVFRNGAGVNPEYQKGYDADEDDIDDDFSTSNRESGPFSLFYALQGNPGYPSELVQKYWERGGSSGQVLTTQSVVGGGSKTLEWVDVNSLISGGFGSITNIVTATHSDKKSHGTGDWSNTGLELTITPSSVNSKILIIFVHATGGGNDSWGGLRIRRNDNTIWQPSSTATRSSSMLGVDEDDDTDEATYADIVTVFHIDEPTTTSSLTYKTQGRGRNFYTNATYKGLGSATSYMYAIEIGQPAAPPAPAPAAEGNKIFVKLPSDDGVVVSNGYTLTVDRKTVDFDSSIQVNSNSDKEGRAYEVTISPSLPSNPIAVITPIDGEGDHVACIYQTSTSKISYRIIDLERIKSTGDYSESAEDCQVNMIIMW